MKRHKLLPLVAGCAFALAVMSVRPALAQTPPKSLRGQIITNARPIEVPTTLKNFAKKLKRQDRKVFKRDGEGKWVIHFVAFFKTPLPSNRLGVVVLDAKMEPVAVADVAGEKGQKTLSSEMVVDTTETVGKPHIIQVFYPKGKKPVILAKKQIVLK